MAGKSPVGLVVSEIDKKPRCWWCGDHDDYRTYHDDEWGFPVDEDHRLFEKVCLEGFQAGLSWLTILRKRSTFRTAFDHFDFDKVARYKSKKVESLLVLNQALNSSEAPANRPITRRRKKINLVRFSLLLQRRGDFRC